MIDLLSWAGWPENPWTGGPMFVPIRPVEAARWGGILRDAAALNLVTVGLFLASRRRAAGRPDVAEKQREL